MNPSSPEPYARLAGRLLQGPLYDEESGFWSQLEAHFTAVYQHFAGIGLEVVRAERDGLAFLRQMVLNPEGDTIGLIPRIPLTYEQSMLCVILREWLDEFDLSDAPGNHLYVTKKELLERIELFFKDQPNKVRQLQQIDRLLQAIEKIGFLRIIHTDSADEERYEVRRIIKYKVTNDELEEFLRVLSGSSNGSKPD